MATLSDSFTRADSSTLGANWTLVYGEFTIVSNAVRQTFTGALIRSALYTGGSLASNDYAVQCVTIIPTAANIAGGVCARYSSTGNGQGYALIAGNGGAGLYRVSGGNIAALLASYPDAGMTAGSTHTLRLECEGTTVRAYINGTLRATVTDSNYSSGGVGLATYNATTGATHLGMDDWTAYDLGAAVEKRPLFRRPTWAHAPAAQLWS